MGSFDSANGGEILRAFNGLLIGIHAALNVYAKQIVLS